MKIIEHYVLGNYLRNFVLSLLVLIFIYIIINLFDNLGSYLSKNVHFWDIIVYYLYLTPSYTILLIPIASIIGVFFIFGYMTKNRELLALRSNGMDINSLFFLIIIAGIFISIFTFVFQETIGVWAQEKLYRHKMEKIDRRQVPVEKQRRNFFYYGEDNWLYYIKHLNARDSTMANVTLWKFGKEQRIEKRIDAVSAHYQGVWEFMDVTIRKFDTLGNESLANYDKYPLPELAEKPEDFLRRIKPVEEMNFLEIQKFVKRKMRAGENVAKEQVELNYRFSFPVITLILLLIALPISVVLRRGGIAVGLGMSIVIAFVYWGLIQSCRAYGYAGEMEPFLAAWLPNFIFIGIGIFTMAGVRR
ncbi:MAG: LptF/LptG family permease [candidate division WOR-3 bacterium]